MFFPLQFGAVTELQRVENSADDLQAHVAKVVSTNDEDKQLREALYGTTQITLFVRACVYVPATSVALHA